MGYLALFVCLLGAAILLVMASGSLPAAQVARIVRYVGAGLLGLAALFLGLTGRLGLAIPAAVGAWALFRGNIGALGGLGKAFPGLGSKSAGQTSDIETPWLAMWLDHDTGHMDGRVRRGRFAGAELSSLSREDLDLLRTEVAGDEESLRLLDAYLERVFGEAGGSAGAGDEGGQQEEAAAPTSGQMTRDEAYEVLGLQVGAGPDAIKAAHRELMQKLHPDRGGSSYLAAKINQAKDLLLKGAAQRS